MLIEFPAAFIELIKKFSANVPTLFMVAFSHVDKYKLKNLLVTLF
jgi:hypothetical protein